MSACASCSDGTSCDTCNDASMNVSLDCTCPPIFYTDTHGVCQGKK